ncbi:MAG: DUF4760 domain-containing protein [Bacillota bacterium]
MAKPTYQDADLILRLYDMRREEVLRKARKWFASEFKAKTLDEFKAQCPPGSDANAYFRQVTSYWDMVAALVLQGLLNEDLFYSTTGEHIGVWMAVQPWVGQLREERKNPRYLAQVEELAKRHLAWRERRLAQTVTPTAPKTKAKVRKAGRAPRPAAKATPRRGRTH